MRTSQQRLKTVIKSTPSDQEWNQDMSEFKNQGLEYDTADETYKLCSACFENLGNIEIIIFFSYLIQM